MLAVPALASGEASGIRQSPVQLGIGPFGIPKSAPAEPARYRQSLQEAHRMPASMARQCEALRNVRPANLPASHRGQVGDARLPKGRKTQLASASRLSALPVPGEMLPYGPGSPNSRLPAPEVSF